MYAFHDSVSAAATAFDSYAALCDACFNGYVPTLRGRTRRERILIRLLLADGYTVWGCTLEFYNMETGRMVTKVGNW